MSEDGLWELAHAVPLGVVAARGLVDGGCESVAPNRGELAPTRALKKRVWTAGRKRAMVSEVPLRNILALLLVTACQAPPVEHTGFVSVPEGTTAPVTPTDAGSSSALNIGTSTGEASSSDSGDTTAESLPPDHGALPDFGGGSPVGCKGKIDFLFVISRLSWMEYYQPKLAAAWPQFIATIESKFADFDYHIMVVTGDDGWGDPVCTEVCPTPGCKVGEPCCPWHHPDYEGTPCCTAPDYPCQDLDLVSECDRTWGAGEVFPAGPYGPANKPCPIDGDRRYLVKGQTDLEQTFACIATVGTGGWLSIGHALVAALQKPINDPGGCNSGFLREDALLMVTFVSSHSDTAESGSEGTPADWAKAVIDAKHGDERSVVMLHILDGFQPECFWADRICQMTEMFPYRHYAGIQDADYGPAFATATNLVDTACAGFVPPE